MRFSVVLEREEEAGGYSAHVPALPGCHSQGETRDEALENVKEAIEMYISYLRDKGEMIPQEDVVSVEVAA